LHGQVFGGGLQIALGADLRIAAAMRLFLETWHDEAATGLRREAELQRTLIGSPNQREAVQANFERRAPKFTTE
jgi:enoyl-CoA hydratase/carnithine racemase